MNDFKAIMDEVLKERIRQNEKWGEQNHDPEIWCMILGEEVGEVNTAALEANFSAPHMNSDNEAAFRKHMDNYREELIQVAAVAVSMVQCFDRNKDEMFNRMING